MTWLSDRFPMLLLAIALMWLGAFLSFVGEVRAPDTNQPHQADGIVVLTGTPARLKEGFHLLKTGAGSRLLISGVHTQVSRETLRQAFGESDSIMNCCVDIDRKALDTVGNAYETSLWAQENQFKSLLVVTSAYHIPRSLVELKRQMPGVALHPVAVTDGMVDLQNWWKKPKVIYILIAEFNKYLFSLIRSRTESYVMTESN